MRGSECGLHIAGTLAEVSPASDVQGHDPLGAQQLGRSGRIRAGRRQRRTVEQGRAGGAGEQERHIDRPEPRGDVVNDGQGGVFTAGIDRGQPDAAHDESGDVAGQRVRSLLGRAGLAQQ